MHDSTVSASMLSRTAKRVNDDTTSAFSVLPTFEGDAREHRLKWLCLLSKHGLCVSIILLA
jgi:hypothetical protein